jgi:hypothetical protein
MSDELGKEREFDTSQLNRLGVAYFLLVYFRFQPQITSAFRRRNSCQRLSFSPPNFWRMRETRLALAQFLAEG